MHLTSSLIVTGVVIYASQGVGSGESGPLPENFSGSSLDVMLHIRPKLEGSGPGEHPKKIGTPTYFCNRLKNWYTTGLPCQTQVFLGPNYVGSELGE